MKLAGKPAPDTYLAAARTLGVDARAGGRLRGRAVRRGGRPRRRVRLRRRRRPRRPGGGAAPPRRGRRRDGPGRAPRGEHDSPPRVPRRAVGAPRDRAAPRHPRAERVALRALQRPHRTARQPRRGRAARSSGLVPERLLRAPLHCRTPKPATASPSPARRSSTSPTASCSDLLVDDEPFDVRYGNAAHARASPRLPRGDVEQAGGVDFPRRAHGARDLDATRVLHAAVRSSPSATRSSRSTVR